MKQLNIVLLTMFFITLAVITEGCSTYKQNGKCYDYKPLGCFYHGMRRVCEINSDGCETCNCIPFQPGKDKPFEKREAW